METPYPDSTDLVHLYRLIHELCEMGDDAYAWRARMLSELRAMVDADMCTAYVLKTSLDPGDITPNVVLKFHQEADDSWGKYVDMGDVTRDPVTPSIMRRFGTDFTVARQELVDDAVWYSSEFFQSFARVNNWDQAIYSQVAITPPGLVDGLGIVRSVGKPAFTEAEVAIVRFVHQELARLWRRSDPLGIHQLPTRQREVLEGIRRGESRKAIAERLCLSDHTVHTHEKALFARAEVNSRGELLARLAKRVQPNLLP